MRFRSWCPGQRDDGCQDDKDDTYNRVIPELHPDIIVVMNSVVRGPGVRDPYLGPDRQQLPNGSPEYNAWLEQTTTEQ